MRRVALAALILLAACAAPEERRAGEVAFGMWAGDEARNRYMREVLAPELEDLYGIRLRVVPTADIAELVNKLLTEKGAGRDKDGSVDLLWINGENFRTAKQGGVLWGPFADRLPNLRHYAPAVYERDFGEPVEGYEAPWQKAQFVMGYDAARVAEPPATIPELFEWVRAHPGRFTYLAPPDFTGSAFLRHLLYHFGGGPEPFLTGFDEALYEQTAAQVFALLNDVKPHLWRAGETYPVTLKEMDRLFANNEIDFAMSYNPNFVSRRIELGQYPPTARTFVFESGTIGNYNFLAIPFNAGNRDGAVTVINHLLSPESALSMSAALRIPFPLRLDHLTDEQRRAVRDLPRGVATLPDDALQAALLPEPDSRYLSRLEKDWFREVLQQ